MLLVHRKRLYGIINIITKKNFVFSLGLGSYNASIITTTAAYTSTSSLPVTLLVSVVGLIVPSLQTKLAQGSINSEPKPPLSGRKRGVGSCVCICKGNVHSEQAS